MRRNWIHTIVALTLLMAFSPVLTAQNNAVPWQVMPTAKSMNLVLPANLVPEVNGAPIDNGDAIGVFYLDSNGTEKCAGYTYWNFQKTIIVVYGSDGYNPGIEKNDYLKLKLWRKGDDCILQDISYEYRTEDIILSYVDDDDAESYIPFKDGMTYIITKLVASSDDISVTYPGREFCQSSSDAVLPEIEGRPDYISFTADSGLVVDAHTGQLDLGQSAPGMYTIYFESNSCFRTGSYSVRVFAKPELETNMEMNCSETLLSAVGGEGRLLWSTGDTLDNIATTDTGLYWARLTNDHGCYDADTLHVKNTPLDISNMTWLSTDAGCDEKGRLVIDKTSIGSGLAPYDFELTNELTGEQYVQSNTTFGAIDQGRYVLAVTDNLGCRKNLNEYIHIDKPEDCDNYVITPDGDGMDDEIYFDQPGNIKIYNRYGQLQADFYGPVYWKATDNSGAPLPMGLYIAIIDGNAQKKITVIR